MADLPRKAVVMLVYNQNGEALLTKRSIAAKTLPGLWGLPAGLIEDGETFEDTAIRELEEEFGLIAKKVEFREMIERPDGNDSQISLVEVQPEWYTGTPEIQTHEIEEIEWIKLEDFFKKYKAKEMSSTLKYLKSKKTF